MSKAKENASLASRLRSAVGSLVTSDSDSLETLPVGTDGQVLTADSAQPNGIKWAAAGASGLSAGQITDLTDSGASTLHYHASDRDVANATGVLAIANGGTSAATAQAAINAVSAVSGATAGHVLTKVGTDAVWAAVSGAGVGDVSGPASAVASNIAAFDGVTGKLLKDGGVLSSSIVTKTGAETLTNKTMSTGSTWGGNTVSPLFGGTGQTSYVKGDTIFSSATNTLAKLPIGSLGEVLTVSSAGIPEWAPAGGSVSTVDSAYGNGITDASAEIQSKIDIVSAAGGGVVQVPSGTYILNTTLTIPSFVTVTGKGISATILKVKDSVNVSAITTTDTSTLINGVTAGGAKYWGITDLTIDGNKANNTAGHGIYTYSRTFKIERVKVMNAKQHGVYTQWCAACAAWDDDAADSFMESYINDVLIQTCGGCGLYYDGPHDGRVSNVIAAINSQTTNGAFDGVYVGSRAGGTQFSMCHSWGDTQRYAWNITANYIYCNNCVADDAYTALVYVNGSHFSWGGGHAFGAVWVTPPTAQDIAMRGFVLSSNAWHPNIVTTVTDSPAGAIDFTAAPNGSGTIIINGSMSAALNTYAATVGYAGTPPNKLNVQINIYDPDTSDSVFNVRAGAPTDDSSCWYDATVAGYHSTTGTAITIGAASSTVNPPVWVQNTTSWTSGVSDHFVTAGLFETIKTTGASCPNSLSGSVKVTGGTGDAIGLHGQVVSDITNGGAMTGVWARATGPTSAPTTGMICGLEVNVDNRHGTTSYKARKEAGSLVGALIYNFSGAGKSNHFGFVIEGTTTDAFHVGGLIEDWVHTGINLTATRSNTYGIHITSEADNYIGIGLAFTTKCLTAGISLGDNKINWGNSSGTVANEGDMLYNATSNVLYFNQGGVTKEMLCGSGVGTSGSYTADRKMAVSMGGVTYYVLMSTTA
jgi:hypothetical protein